MKKLLNLPLQLNTLYQIGTVSRQIRKERAWYQVNSMLDVSAHVRKILKQLLDGGIMGLMLLSRFLLNLFGH